MDQIFEQMLLCTWYNSPNHMTAADYMSWESRFTWLIIISVPSDQSLITIVPSD